MKRSLLLLLLMVILCAAPALAAEQVVIKTTHGEIVLELNEEKAPATVKNFLRYVDEGFYEGTIFHRVMAGFMIQGGGFTGDLRKKPTHAPIPNEAHNGLKNDRGTIAMARTSDVDSATAQFYINLVDNDFLNHKDKTRRGYGYAVFGKVIEGMEVVDRIAGIQTRRQGPFQNLPVEPVVIESVERLKAD